MRKNFFAAAWAFHSKSERGVFAKKEPPNSAKSGGFRAGKEVRTLDIQLGKLTLYQLSYSREHAQYIKSGGVSNTEL